MFERKLYRRDMIQCALCHNAPCSAACPEMDPAALLRSIWFNNEIGFGELGVHDDAGVMDFTRSESGGWVQYESWTLTLYPDNYPLPDGL